MSVRIAVLFSALVSTFAVSGAHAQPSGPSARPIRLAILPFEGEGADEVHAAVTRGLARTEGLEVIPTALVREAATETGADIDAGQGLERVARRLDLVAFVEGQVTRERRRVSVTLRVRRWDGLVVGERSVGKRSIAAMRLETSAFTYVESFLRNAEEQASEMRNSAARGAAEGAPLDDERPSISLPETSDDEESGSSSDASSDLDRYSTFSIGILGSTLHRTLSATVAPARLGGLTEPRSYASAGLGHGELGVDFEFYPGALGEGQPFPYVGLVGSYRRSVGLASVGCSPATPTDACPSSVSLDTMAQQLYGGLRGRYTVLGKASDGLHLGADVGVDYFQFAFNTADLAQLDYSAIVPTLDYVTLLFGGRVAYDLVARYLRLAVHGGYRYGLRIGDAARSAWGDEAKVTTSFEAGAQLRSQAPYIAEGLYFGVDFTYFAFQTSFQGATVCSSSSCDAPPALYEALTVPEPVKDSYMRLGLTVGYAL